jgi:hypothetical protein
MAVAISLYAHPNFSEDSSAPGRGLMPGGAGQLSSGGGGQGCGAGAVTAEPSWVAERPRRRDLGAVGPPSGWSPARGCPDAGQAGRCPVRAPGPAVGDVRPAGRADVQRPGVRCPGVRCPGVRTDTLRVRGAAATLSAPRWIWSGSVWRAAPSWAQPVDVPRGRRAAWSPAGLGPDGREGAALAWLARTRVDPGPGPPCGRRRGGGAALAPAGRHGRWSRPGCRPGRGAWGAGAHRPRPGVLGALVGVVPTRGLDQQLVTTLRGRWARVVPWRPAPEGPPGSVGEQPAAARRPRRVRSAVG